MQERQIELINDLVALGVVMEELWDYHPENPNKKDIVAEYMQLQKIQGSIESELGEMG
tara:strand:- start:1036 stop:1209 length:174 start_codon:yes stop_codon:yes gene_type:complete